MNTMHSRNFIILIFFCILFGCHSSSQRNKHYEEEDADLPSVVGYSEYEEDWKDEPERTEQLKFELYYKEFGRIKIPHDSLDRSYIDYDIPMLIDLRFGEKLSNKLLIKIDLIALKIPFWFDLYQNTDSTLMFSVVQVFNVPSIDSITLVKQDNVYKVKKASRTEKADGGFSKICWLKVVEVDGSVEFEVWRDDSKCVMKKRGER